VGEPAAGADGPVGRQPTRAELLTAYGRTVPDLGGPGIRVLLCGINPSLWSGLVGYHFARPANRLWATLHLAGFTSRLLHPSETGELVAAGIGVTNLVARATARADELSAEAIRGGLDGVAALAARWEPAYVAFLGLSAYRVATRQPRAQVGPQERLLGPSRVWLLPNPSGLNASYQLPALVEAYAQLREAAYGCPAR
jgi:TDG/mug DNA glycosylase family protein